MAECRTFTIKEAFAGKDGIKNTLITFDALVTEAHRFSTDITKNPVEDKVEITDFLIKNPLIIDIEGFITDTPPTIESVRLTEIETDLLNRGFPVDSSNIKLNRRQRVYDAINYIYENRILVDIRTNLKTYTLMVIEDARLSLTDTTGQGMPISMTLRKVDLAFAKATTISRRTPEQPLNAQTSEEEDVGAKAPISRGFRTAFGKLFLSNPVAP